MIRILFAVLICMFVATPMAMADDERPGDPSPSAGDTPEGDAVMHMLTVFKRHLPAWEAEAMPLPFKAGVPKGTQHALTLPNPASLDSPAAMAAAFGKLMFWTQDVWIYYTGQKEPALLPARAAQAMWGAIADYSRLSSESAENKGNIARALVWEQIAWSADKMSTVARFAARNGEAVLGVARKAGAQGEEWAKLVFAAMGL